MDNVLFCHLSIERILTSLTKMLCEEIPCGIWLFIIKAHIYIKCNWWLSWYLLCLSRLIQSVRRRRQERRLGRKTTSIAEDASPKEWKSVGCISFSLLSLPLFESNTAAAASFQKR